MYMCESMKGVCKKKKKMANEELRIDKFRGKGLGWKLHDANNLHAQGKKL